MDVIPGQIHVICGPMMSGKSKRLFEVIDELSYKEISYFLFKKEIQGANSESITSRFLDQKVTSISVKNAEEILKHVNVFASKTPTCILIDEAQFFSPEILTIVKFLSFCKFTIFLFGLDLDANGNTFGSMGHILSLADVVHKTTAVCAKCKKTATKTELFSERPKDFEKNNIILENENNILGSLCNDCFYSDPSRIKKMNEIYQKFKV